MVDRPASPPANQPPIGRGQQPARRAGVPNAVRPAAQTTARPAPGAQAAQTRAGAAAAAPKAGASKKPARKKAKKKPWRSLTRGQKVGKVTLWAAVCLVGLLIIGMIAAIVYYETTPIPDPNADFTTSTTTIYYNDGTTVLGRLSVQNRTPLAYDDMPQAMKDAVVAAEDRTFWTNSGISVPGMIRAAWNILRGGDIQSGSTLTQQYVKTMYLTNAQTASRKVKELAISIKMTNAMSKEQILAGYLNTVYIGRGAYGVQAAAKAYFNIDAKDLTVPQAAVLTSLLRGPAIYDPSDASNLPRLLDRYNYVLDSMVETGTLTQAEETKYKGTLPDFPKVPSNQTYGGTKGYLMKMVESELQQVAGLTSAQVAGGGLKIVTTFDANMQQAAVDSAQKFTKQSAEKARVPQDPAELHAAIASVAVGAGEVLAVYGGPDFVKNNRNWATTPRMTGSTFKPFGFIAGERNGASLNSQLNGDTIKSNGSTIHNDGYARYGTVSLLTATQKSINTAFIDLVQQTPDGPNQVIKAAEDAGVTPDNSWQAVPSIVLGTAEASPLAMASAYATFDNDGASVATHVVKEVMDPSGAIVYQANPTTAQAIEPDIARDLTYALQSVVDAGTGVAAKSLGYPAAGKTGTAGCPQGTCAGWFVGFTKQISTAVMFVAGDQGVSDLDPFAPRGYSTFFGSGYPAQTWVDYMKQAMQGMQKVDFAPPAYVNGGQPTVDTPTTEDTTADIPVEFPSEPSSVPVIVPSTGPSTQPPDTSTTTVPPTTVPPTTVPPTTATTAPPPTTTSA